MKEESKQVTIEKVVNLFFFSFVVWIFSLIYGELIVKIDDEKNDDDDDWRSEGIQF